MFSVFATLSLVDLVSGSLGRIRETMGGVELGMASLGTRMGNLTMAMAPVAAASAVVLAAFGMASAAAMRFESALADVAKVVNFESKAELEAMSSTIKDMAGRIPMAAEGIAAIIAAAGQSGVAKQDLAAFAEQAAKMGVAFDLTGDQAGKMMADWRAGMDLTLPQVYALADATNHLSNNMNATAPALGEVIQRVGAVAMTAGLAETQVAALGAAFLSAGASPEIAATALKNFTTTLVKGTAMSDAQAAAFRSVGFSATQLAKDMQTDAQSTIFAVMQAIADKPKELQTSLLTTMFGQESLGAIAPLLQNMGNLSQAFELVSDSTKYAGSMQKEFETRSKTTENALQLLSNKLTNLGISIGTIFLPAIAVGAKVLGALADGARMLAETPLGRWVIAVTGGIATLLVGMTALSALLWGLSGVTPLFARALLPLKTALLGLGAPVWALIAILGTLYLAYRTNFGGIADTLHRWWKTATLVVRGVVQVFASLKDGVGEIRGELATDIKAAGLAGLVTTVSRGVQRVRVVLQGLTEVVRAAVHRMQVLLVPMKIMVAEGLQSLEALFQTVPAPFETALDSVQGLGNRLQAYTTGLWQALSGSTALLGEALGRVWSRIQSAFSSLIKLGESLGTAFSKLWTALAPLFGAEVTTGTSAWERFGNLVGNLVAAALYVLATAIQLVVNAFDVLVNAVRLIISLFTGDMVGATDTLRSIIGGIGEAFATFGDLFGVGDSIRAAWAEVMAFFDSINLFESGARLLSTFVEGIKSMAMAPITAVAKVLAGVREYLPFSDAHTGPLSALTLSGSRMMSTLADGVHTGSGTLVESVRGALGDAGSAVTDWQASVSPLQTVPAVHALPTLEESTHGLFSFGKAPLIAPRLEPKVTEPDHAERRGGTTITIANLNLPHVSDASTFPRDLQRMIYEYSGGLA